MAHDMPEPLEFPSLDNFQKRFLCANKEIDLALRTVIGLVLQVGDGEKFPHALGFKSLYSFLRDSWQGQCLTTIKEDGGDNRLLQLELACEADGVALPDPVLCGHCSIA